MKQYIAIFLLFIIFSCDPSQQSAKKKNNKYVMDHELFVKVLKDYALAEGAINVNVLNVSDHSFDSVYHFNIMKKYGLTKAHYDSTVMFYSARPDEFKIILEQVLEHLNKEKAVIAQ